MNIHIYQSEQDVDQAASEVVIQSINNMPSFKLGLATGQSPVGMYAQLSKAYKEGLVSFDQVTSYNLDEYVGLDRGHPHSFYAFMDQHLFQHVDFRENHIYIPNGCADNLHDECKRYDQLLEREGQLDIQILGIGLNGHIGFNEPGETLHAGTHIVELSEHTRKVNSQYFPSFEQVPTKAVTMGIGSILKAKKIVFIAKGEQKSEVIKKAFTGPINPLCPGSFLQLHPNVEVFLDEDSAKLL
ncbi:glucosamine-6-phosphate deaminase [Aquibacillus albus]|uniref:Glucosamine-6-phosphate deaminase n=1 Tax=Aquibacillus albus TaxID=1168171 RepID=A0ABS2MVM2_9BACI|nr:glucosamine-6-phosphate deaminase [Aquibacillus albus]MBM7569961.1 glucosamine-6-phosphate deaminase [Aquibacillus albus]